MAAPTGDPAGADPASPAARAGPLHDLPSPRPPAQASRQGPAPSHPFDLADGFEQDARRPKSSFRRRLIISLVGTAVFAVMLTALLALGLFRLNADRRTEAELRRQVSEVAKEVPGIVDQRRDQPGAPKVPVRALRILGQLDTIELWSLPSGGRPVPVISEGTRHFDAETVAGLDVGGEKPVSGKTHPRGQRPLIYAAQEVQTKSGRSIVILGREAKVGDTFLGGGRFLIGAVLAVLVSILLALWLSSRLDRPLKQMAAAADGIARGEYSHRVEVPAEAELANLADSFNTMAGQVERSRRRERTLLLNVSHDLRTPLTSIKAYAEGLADGTFADETSSRRAGDVIGSEAGRLERLVSDLLDVARLDAGEFSLQFEEVDVGEVLRDVGEAFQPRLVEKDLSLELDLAETAKVITDGSRLAQIVGNLLDNAMRHTGPGGTLAVRLEPWGPGVAILVADSGEGIPRRDLPHIFDRLYVGRDPGSRKVGTGLGLAIVQQLVSAMGGRIAVRSEVRVGTAFQIWLPDRPIAWAGERQ